MKLEKWYTRNNRVIGLVYGHSKFCDGKSVVTSKVVYFNATTREIITALGSIYYLGQCLYSSHEADYLDVLSNLN